MTECVKLLREQMEQKDREISGYRLAVVLMSIGMAAMLAAVLMQGCLG